jgi:murein DD-endopeptidase MepM/ murein hydrolase activator NlpD
MTSMEGQKRRWMLRLALLGILFQTGCRAPSTDLAQTIRPPDSALTAQSATPRDSTAEPPSGSTSPVSLPVSEPAPQGTTPATQPPERETAAPTQLAICSPLEGVGLPDLAEAAVNPYHPPRSGSDDPHQGVDLAYRQPGSGIALAGQPVYAALPGIVAGVIQNRFPYGNAILVETPLDALPSRWEPPSPNPGTSEVHSSLTCPDVAVPLPEAESRSLYTLYAHFEQTPMLRDGEEVSCGKVLGQTGSSGNALNPHVHIEMRVGPSGAQFESMAHYDTSASALEMATYCLWRVSGVFFLADPLDVLESGE